MLVGTTSRLGAASRLSEPPAVVTRGAGPTVVLLSGLLGGTARLEPLAARLVAKGFRVVAIDPYRLAADAADVSFDGLARMVATALHREGVQSSIVVAHGHGSGIALRLAANAPALVTDLFFLDAGVIAGTRSAGVAGAMRVASMVARFPGGRGLIRAQLVSGIRENSGNPRWVSDEIGRAYADPFVAELPAVARMAARLAQAAEPESIDRTLARVRADVTALIGAAPHAFRAEEDELALLRRIPGARLRRVDGVGHFVHEEAATVVIAEVLAAQERRAVAVR
jgi:pimeloyl-ACP methyl ester carboxylesterase